MKQEKVETKSYSLTVLRKCHCCGELLESNVELSRCTSCGKAFMPLNYFSKVTNPNGQDFKHLFSPADELQEEDLIRGLYVIW